MCTSDLGTRIPESEAKSDRVRRLGIVTLTSRFAVLCMTRAKWNCLGDTCELTRADSASDEVIGSGYWFKRWNGESDWNDENDWINLHIRDAGLACGHEQIQRVESVNAAQRRGAVEHPRSEERKECDSGRVRMFSAPRWARLGAGVLHIHRSRDQSLFDEHE